MLSETGFDAGAIQVAGTAMVSQIPFFIAACDYTLIGEEILKIKGLFSSFARHLPDNSGMQLLCGHLISIVHGTHTGIRYPRASIHAHRGFHSGRPISEVTITTGRHPTGRLPLTVNSLPAGFSSEPSVLSCGYTEKEKGLCSPTTGMPRPNLSC